MKPIYFPFSFMTKDTAEKVAQYFKTTFLYLPSKRCIDRHIKNMSDAGALQLRIIEEANDNLDILLKEYRAWADNHNGSELAFLAVQEDKIPFYNDDMIAKIRTSIKKNVSEDKEIFKSDALKRARFLLYIAHEFDKEKFEIDYHIELCKNIEKKLIDAVHDEDKKDTFFLNDIFSVKKDEEQFSITEMRIVSWAHFFLADDISKQQEIFFITDSKAVIEYITYKAEDNFQIIKEPTEIKKNIKYDSDLFLKECIIIKKSPEIFFAEIADRKISCAAQPSNTIIAFFEK